MQSSTSATVIPAPVLVAHRGYPLRFPENTLEGMNAALEAGARAVEFDIQLSADGVPVVIHDQDLQRTAGIELCVLDTEAARLKRIAIGEPARFGDTFAGSRIPTLREMIALLQRWPGTQVFMEIKRASLRRFGRTAVLEPVLNALHPLLDRCVLISFDSEILVEVKRSGICRVGWVIDAVTDHEYETAMQLAPDFLFCAAELIPSSPQWPRPGPWQWGVYEINDPQLALDLARRGAGFIETGAIGEMLRHPLLQQKAGPRDGSP